MWLKSCPRCGGDLYKRHQTEGVEIICMQCSRLYTPSQLLRVLQPEAAPAEIAEREMEEREAAAALLGRAA